MVPVSPSLAWRWSLPGTPDCCRRARPSDSFVFEAPRATTAVSSFEGRPLWRRSFSAPPGGDWGGGWANREDEFACVRVTARHVKQVPGRKTDVSDAAWLCQLLEAGLLERSFVPPKPIRTLRNLTRYRKAQVGELSRLVIGKAQRETRFRCRAVRIASTVVEADVRYPTDAGLARAGVRTLAREGKRLAAKVGGTKGRVRDPSRGAGGRR